MGIFEVTNLKASLRKCLNSTFSYHPSMVNMLNGANTREMSMRVLLSNFFVTVNKTDLENLFVTDILTITNLY